MEKLTLEDIRPYLQGAKQKGAETVATCPLCGKAGHLYIKQEGDKLLLHCQKCNAPGTEIIREFRRLGAKPTEKMQLDYKATKPIEDYYHIYRLPDGTEQFRKRRRKWADGHKVFSFEHTAADGRTVYTKPDNAIMLYNLDKLEQADASTTLYIVEGEKCADSMMEQGLLATTSRTGAQKQIKFTDTDVAALNKFTSKVIIPDNDEKGSDYAAAFQIYACKILNLKSIWPDCPKKGDVADYFKAEGTVEAIKNYEWPQKLTPEYINSMSLATLTDPKVLEQVFQEPPESRPRALLLIKSRARDLGVTRDFNALLKAYQASHTTVATTSENKTTYINSMSLATLTDPKVLEQVFQEPPESRPRALLLIKSRARDLGVTRDFNALLKAYQASHTTVATTSENKTTFTGQPLALRCGKWHAGDDGIYRMKQIGDNGTEEYASKSPIMPIAILVNCEYATERVALKFLVKYQQGREWREKTFPRSVISNKAKIIETADDGVEVTSSTSKILVDYLQDVITSNQDRLPRIKSISHLGWYENQFVPYTDEISIDADNFRELVKSIHSKGTLEEWAEFIKPLWENSVYLRLVISASLASVLVEKCNALPFVLHLWGGSGAGKTVALKVAASVWGSPEHFTQTINMTPNALMQTAGTLRNLPLLGDELQTIKSNIPGQNYDKLIMQLTEGTERGRLSSDARMKQQKTWKNSFIFTGEEPITMANSGGGVKNRVIELECTEKIIANGSATVNFIHSHYGNAGRAFIAYLEGKDIVNDYQSTYSLLLTLTDSSEKQAAALALISIADAYACECIFHERGGALPPTELAKFAKSKEEIDPAERAYNYIMDVVAANADNFTKTNYGDDGRQRDIKAGYGEAWGKMRPDSVVFIKSRLETELAKQGFVFKAVKEKWAEKGYLIKTNQGKFIHNDSINGIKFYSVWLAKPK